MRNARAGDPTVWHDDRALELAEMKMKFGYEIRIAELMKESECPVCGGTGLDLGPPDACGSSTRKTPRSTQPCQECHGSKLISVAYDTLRTRYKRSEQVNSALRRIHWSNIALLEAAVELGRLGGWTRDALAFLEDYHGALRQAAEILGLMGKPPAAAVEKVADSK
jgi:hypothetical protein